MNSTSRRTRVIEFPKEIVKYAKENGFDAIERLDASTAEEQFFHVFKDTKDELPEPTGLPIILSLKLGKVNLVNDIKLLFFILDFKK